MYTLFSFLEPRNCSLEYNDSNFLNCVNTTSCVHKDWICDGEDDCWDNSDEQNCNATAKCTSNEFKCLNGACIDIDSLCDGIADCKDGTLSSDELDCSMLMHSK